VKLESLVADFHLSIDHFPNERHLLQEKVLIDMTIDALLSSLLNPLEGPSVLNCGNMELGGTPDFQH
jgi:hypothetical protein